MLKLDVLFPQHLDTYDRSENGFLVDLSDGGDFLVFSKTSNWLEALKKLNVVSPDGKAMDAN